MTAQLAGLGSEVECGRVASWWREGAIGNAGTVQTEL